MINIERFNKINNITDPIEAAKEYLLTISRFRNNCDTDINEMIFEDLRCRFAEDWARIIMSLYHTYKRE